MQQVQLFDGKCQLSALLTIIIRSNSVGDVYKPCQMSAFDLRPANKGSSGNEEDLVKFLLKSL